MALTRASVLPNSADLGIVFDSTDVDRSGVVVDKQGTDYFLDDGKPCTQESKSSQAITHESHGHYFPTTYTKKISD